MCNSSAICKQKAKCLVLLWRGCVGKVQATAQICRCLSVDVGFLNLTAVACVQSHVDNPKYEGLSVGLATSQDWCGLGFREALLNVFWGCKG